MIYNNVVFDDFAVIEYVRRVLLPSRDVVTQQMTNGRNQFLQVTEGVVPIEVDVRTIAKTREEVFNNYDTMAKALSTYEPSPLFLRDKPGKYNLAVLSGETSLHTFLETGFVTLIFECPDPFLYSEEETTLRNINGVNCLNRGSAPTDGLLTIKMEVSSNELILGIDSSNEIIKINHGFTPGDVITVDLKTEDVIKNNTTVIPSNLSSTFFQIPPGFFTITASSGKVDLVFRERWY